MKILSATLCLLAANVAFAVESHTDSWLRLIKSDYESSCDVALSNVGTVVAGHNGLRVEQWCVQTCHGPFEYYVYYYPPATHPKRASPFAIFKTSSKAWVSRSNYAFKPTAEEVCRINPPLRVGGGLTRR